MNTVLRPVFEGSTIIIAPCDGTQTLDSDGKNPYKLSISTGETPVAVYQMKSSAYYLAEVFDSFGVDDLGELCLTQHQIKAFCEQFRGETFRKYQSHGILFLLKKKGDNGFSGVLLRIIGSDGLYVHEVHYGHEILFYGADGYLVVVPKQEPR